MSDLTPITREEALLDGADLEPITRKEQFIKRIYDKAQEVPEPITREEWFLKKAGEGTSPVTIKKKSIANTPTDIASFDDGTANPMPSLEISIEPVQSGSGDPSPSNVRPISGWSGAQITVTNDLTTPTETHTLSIPFHDSSDNPITVYGGTLNVTSGELTVTYGRFDMGTLNWIKSSEVGHFYGASDKSIFPYKFSDNTKMMFEAYKFDGVGTIGSYYGVDGTVRYWYTSILLNARELYVTDIAGWDAMTAEEYKQSVTGKYIVYELATPQTYQLTPTQVATLLGQNNIFADCGQILEGEYFVTL